jgi:hypothetical protein
MGVAEDAGGVDRRPSESARGTRPHGRTTAAIKVLYRMATRPMLHTPVRRATISWPSLSTSLLGLPEVGGCRHRRVDRLQLSADVHGDDIRTLLSKPDGVIPVLPPAAPVMIVGTTVS